jgi:arylsulfatase A-like enzyme
LEDKMNVKLAVTLSMSITLSIFLVACTPGEKSENTPTPVNKAEKISTKKTNIVFILIDDLCHYGVTAFGANRLHSYDGMFTNKEFSTPNIDSLAKQGLRVDHAFAYPICENTRIALMSGKNNDRNYLQPKSQHRSDITFGDAFQKAGYTTGLYGKWKQTRGDSDVAGKEYISEFGWEDYAA